MAIISGLSSKSKEKIKAEVNSEIMAKINQYCEWANIEDVGFFIEEAAHYVFTKDKDWKQHLKALKKSTKEMA